MPVARYKIYLQPHIFSEHYMDPLSRFDGEETYLQIDPLRDGLHLSNIKVDSIHKNSDFVHEGCLLVMPDKDGYWID
jgi:hypothetical protein